MPYTPLRSEKSSSLNSSTVLSATVTPDPVAPYGTVSLSGSASITLSPSWVNKLIAGLGATGMTIDTITVGIDTTGSVVQSAHSAEVTSINSSPLPMTIPVANLSSPIPGVLSTVKFTAVSSAVLIDLSPGTVVIGFGTNLPNGQSIANQGATCIPGSTQTFASIPIQASTTTRTTVSTTTSTTLVPTTAPPTTRFNICRHIPLFLLTDPVVGSR